MSRSRRRFRRNRVLSGYADVSAETSPAITATRGIEGLGQQGVEGGGGLSSSDELGLLAQDGFGALRLGLQKFTLQIDSGGSDHRETQLSIEVLVLI